MADEETTEVSEQEKPGNAVSTGADAAQKGFKATVVPEEKQKFRNKPADGEDAA